MGNLSYNATVKRLEQIDKEFIVMERELALKKRPLLDEREVLCRRIYSYQSRGSDVCRKLEAYLNRNSRFDDPRFRPNEFIKFSIRADLGSGTLWHFVCGLHKQNKIPEYQCLYQNNQSIIVPDFWLDPDQEITPTDFDAYVPLTEYVERSIANCIKVSALEL